MKEIGKTAEVTAIPTHPDRPERGIHGKINIAFQKTAP